MKQLGQSILRLEVVIALPRPMHINGRVLAATVAESITIPAGAHYVLLAGNVDFWVSFRTTATVLAADTNAGDSMLFVPGGTKELRMLEGAETLSVVSSYACLVTAEFFE